MEYLMYQLVNSIAGVTRCAYTFCRHRVWQICCVLASYTQGS